jgi:hypothetical protein
VVGYRLGYKRRKGKTAKQMEISTLVKIVECGQRDIEVWIPPLSLFTRSSNIITGFFSFHAQFKSVLDVKRMFPSHRRLCHFFVCLHVTWASDIT